jgi:hypothetical protein
MAVDEGVTSLAAFGGNCADRLRAKPVASTSWQRIFQKVGGRLLGHPWDLFASGQHADHVASRLLRVGFHSSGNLTSRQRYGPRRAEKATIPNRFLLVWPLNVGTSLRSASVAPLPASQLLVESLPGIGMSSVLRL